MGVRHLSATILGLAMMVMPAVALGQVLTNAPGSADRLMGDLSPVHDPAIIKQGDT